MLLRIILSFLIFTSFSNNLFTMSRENKTLLSNIKEVELIDKDYRTIAVLPFENLTGDDHYSYIGKTIQKFLSDNLSIMNKIKISTNDYLISRELKTNKNIFFSYGTNLLRKVIILNPDTIYKKYIEFHDPDDLKAFSRELGADYIISGSYKLKKKTRNNFDLSYNIFNVIREEQVYNNHKVLDHKKIDFGIEKISTDIIQYFYPCKTSFVRIVTDFSNYQLYIDNKLIRNKADLYQWPVGQRHKIKIHTLGYHPVETNIILRPLETNIFSFFQKDLFKDKVSLIVNSEPADASVFLNVKHLGYTPIKCTNLLPGKYRLKVVKSNYSSYFQNIDIRNVTNNFFISLEKIYSKEYYEQRHKRNKLIMYISLGAGTLLMLNTYYFYARADDEYDKWKIESDESLAKKYSENYRKNSLIWSISGIAGIGALTVSLIYFFKVLDHDDANIGLDNRNINTEFAVKNNNNYIFLKYKF